MCFLIIQLFSNGLLITSLGASAFIAFGFPKAESSRLRHLLGGYACGSICGVVFGLLMVYVCSINGIADMFPYMIVFSVLAVFLTSFLMMAFDMQHPPAAALSISLVIDGTPIVTALIAMVAIALICLLRYGFLRAFGKKL
ncbi:MAG: HPP family protein [Christensenellaceae bacterium]|jgi:CBS-domain-containing membrane protein